MTDRIKQEFWERLEDTRVGMLTAGSARPVPMSHYVDEDSPSPTLWFITAQGTDLAEAAVTGSDGRFIVCSTDGQLHARIDGHLSLSTDRAELERLWNGVAGAWFEGGRDDPDVRLLRFDLSEAEVWVTGGSLKFLYEIGRAHLTDSKPDIGDHALLRF